MSRLLRKGTYMSRATNKTLQRNLKQLRETGQMSPWLEKRLSWDTVTRDQILAEMFQPEQEYDWWSGPTSIPSPRYSHKIIGLTVPEGL